MSQSKGVEAVERALSILDCFGTEVAELSLAEIARRTGLYKSTILRLAVSLEKFGYVSRSQSSRFRLGPTAGRLGAAYRQNFDLASVLRPQLKRLSETTNETASFYIREGDLRVCLFRHEPQRAIRHSIEEGIRLPLNRGASGKILTAFSGEMQADSSQEYKGNGASRIAISKGERDPEVAAIATSVFSISGQFVGALAVSGLITRFTPDRCLVMKDALEEHGKALENLIIR